MIFKKYCVTHGGDVIRTFWRRKSAIRYRDAVGSCWSLNAHAFW